MSENILTLHSDDEDDLNMNQLCPVVVNEKVDDTTVFSPNSFHDTETPSGEKIHPNLLKQLDYCGFKRMTHIQASAIPVILQGHDTMVRSFTGSGKTLCFAIPIIHLLMNMYQQEQLTRKDGTVVVVLSPTRELCLQTHSVLAKLSQMTPHIVISSLTGGEKRKSEKARLRKGVTILLGTPGRLLDHLETTASFVGNKLRLLVLDEADRLLDMGFEKTIRLIYDNLSSQIDRVSDRDLAKSVLLELYGEKKREELEDVFEEEEDAAHADFNDDEDDDICLNLVGRVPKDRKKGGKDKKKEKTEKDLSQIKAHQKIQAVLVSATLTPLVRRLSSFCLRNEPTFIGMRRVGNLVTPVVAQNLQEFVGELTNDQSENNGERREGAEIGEERWMNASFAAIPAQLVQKCIQIQLKSRLVSLITILLQAYNQKKKVIVYFSTCQAVEYHYAFLTSIRWPRRIDSGSSSSTAANSPHPLQDINMTSEVREALKEFADLDSSCVPLNGIRKNKKKKPVREQAEDEDDFSNYPPPSQSKDDKKSFKNKRLTAQDFGTNIFQGIKLFKLFGNMSKDDRSGFLQDFNQTPSSILLTTDVASRGLNINNVDVVVQLDPPQQIEEYYHRIGRTARLDQKGESVILLNDHEMGFLEELKKNNQNRIAISSELELFNQLKGSFAPQSLGSIKQLSSFLASWFCRVVESDMGLKGLACEAFGGSRKAYSTFSRGLKGYFDVKKLHLGHLANAFGLNDTPSAIAAFRRKGWERQNERAEMSRDEKYSLGAKRKREAMEKGKAGGAKKMRGERRDVRSDKRGGERRGDERRGSDRRGGDRGSDRRGGERGSDRRGGDRMGGDRRERKEVDI